LAGGGVHTVTLPTSSGSAAAGNVIYYGYINTDTPFTSVTFDYAGPTGGGADYFGFDNMTIGSVQQVVATPDGGLSLMLLGSAFAGIAVFRRKFA
jgi:hypothetical protein